MFNKNAVANKTVDETMEMTNGIFLYSAMSLCKTALTLVVVLNEFA